MDIYAKRRPADENGARIGFLDGAVKILPESVWRVHGLRMVESENAIAPESNEVTELGNEENVVTKDSVGFIINEDTPEILLSEDGKHIDLYTAISLNWKATQEILQRLEALEGSEN